MLRVTENIRKIKTNLEVKLTEPELKDCSKKLAEALNQKATIESAIETFKAQKKAELSQIDSVIQRNMLLINSEREFRLIECELRYDWKAGKKRAFRMDSGECIYTQAIEADERQEEMFPQPETAGK